MSKKRADKNRKWGGEHKRVFKEVFHLKKLSEFKFDGTGDIQQIRKTFCGNEVKIEDRFIYPRVVDFLFDTIKSLYNENQILKNKSKKVNDGDIVVISKTEYEQYQKYFALLIKLQEYHRQINDFLKLKVGE